MSTSDGIIVSQKPECSVDGIPLFRGEGIVDASPLAILNLIWNSSRFGV